MNNSQANIVDTRPTLAGAVGVMAIVLGVFLTAFHGNEWMKQTVMSAAMPPAGQQLVADCPAAELEEEGISVAECHFMVDYVVGLHQSMPDWFPATQASLSFIGTLLAFTSILAGAALVNGNPRAPGFALLAFSALALVDFLQFAVVVNAGPIIRSLYLWHILLWFLLHLMMAIAIITARGNLAGKDNISGSVETQ